MPSRQLKTSGCVLPNSPPYYKLIGDCLKVMNRAASCKHRQAVKTLQCETKLFNSHLHFS